MNKIFYLGLIMVYSRVASVAQPTIIADTGSSWAYELLHIPSVTSNGAVKEPIIVAIVDDGFRLSHNLLKDFVYVNPKELPSNSRDDDNNGYADDLSGWDISDNDADVGVPQGKESLFYHGTMVAGAVVTILQKAYGGSASRHVKLLPIKVLSDQATNTYLADGYKGIKYAMDQGAKIICCAWSGGTASPAERSILLEAHHKGIIVVGSVGNLSSEKVYPPASIEGVVAVAAVDTALRKLPSSNFGMRVDLCAPGDKVLSASSLHDTYYTYGMGTSAATALVTGCLALLKTQEPQLSTELIEALLNTTSPIDLHNLGCAGKLGSGIPDLHKALMYLQNAKMRLQAFDSLRPKGKILYTRPYNKIPHWNIHPQGTYKSIHIGIDKASNKDLTAQILIKTKDSVYYQGLVKGLIKGLTVPGGHVQISFPKRSKRPKKLSLTYFAEAIDSTTLYCKDFVALTQSQGIITDGSGGAAYASRCACKWQITAPIGKRIRIEFAEMDTEANMDFVWLFDGTKTIPEYIIAKFSGKNMPPIVVSRTNEVLLWFVSNEAITGAGWKLKYSFVD